jgi:alpha-beta hydrolase superfamily lysophospholipase
MLKSPDGTLLHVVWYAPARLPVRGAAVLLHGYSAHVGLMEETAQFLADHGLLVYGFDCRGHGQSTGRRGYVRKFEEFRTDLGLVLAEVRARHPNLPLALLGHSHGATIALDSVLGGETPVAALILVCPFLGLAMRVPWYKRWSAGILGVLWPTLALGSDLDPQILARDASVRERLARDPLRHHVATARWFREVKRAQAAILARASELRVPTWMALAGGDRLVDNAASLAFAKAAGPVVTVKVYERAFHEILLDGEREQVRSDIATWVVAPLLSPYNSEHS